MKPMLARTLGKTPPKLPVYIQPKLNGIRALYQDGVFQSRDEKVWNPAVLIHLTNALQTLVGPGFLLDGELYAHGWKLGAINSAVAVKKTFPDAKTPFVQYCVFDVVNPALPFSERFFPLYHHIKERNLIEILPVATEMIYLNEEIPLHHATWVARGFEGIMLRTDAPYEFSDPRNGSNSPYRSTSLWKKKHWEDAEFLCVGVTLGEGKASIGIGALICITESGNTFHVGSGFDDEERAYLAAVPPINKMITVKFNSLSADGIPVPGIFVAVREQL